MCTIMAHEIPSAIYIRTPPRVILIINQKLSFSENAELKERIPLDELVNLEPYCCTRVESE
jgi:hypothetical protein